MTRILAAAAVAAFSIATPDLAGAQNQHNDAISASRFDLTIDGVQVVKPKAKELKAPGGKPRSGVTNYKVQNAWPKKGY